ncbi:MAG: helix-turn-helix domain-containing protein [Corynebacterium flavescens]
MAIIDLLLQSHSVHDIADSLGVSIPTVYKTRSSFECVKSFVYEGLN